MSFRALLADVRAVTLDAYLHQDVPLSGWFEELSPARSLNVTPLFQVVFALQNAPGKSQRLGGLEIERIIDHEFQVRFDLEVHAIEHDGGLSLYRLYNRDLFDRWRIEQMAEHYVTLLDAALAAPDAPLHQLEMCGAEERHALLERFNTAGEPAVTTTVPNVRSAGGAHAGGAGSGVRGPVDVLW